MSKKEYLNPKTYYIRNMESITTHIATVAYKKEGMEDDDIYSPVVVMRRFGTMKDAAMWVSGLLKIGRRELSEFEEIDELGVYWRLKGESDE